MNTEKERTERVRNQGIEDGLFRACMDAIRKSHTLGQSLRNASIAAGLLTDKNCYAEMLGQFYVVTAALEQRMDELLELEQQQQQHHHQHENKSIDDDTNAQPLLVNKIKALGYSFQSGYENDLQTLLGTNWKETINSWTTSPAQSYIRKLKSATDAECAAAAFILHGPLIIGGGAALKPRVEKAFGKNVTHVFQSVVGAGRGGRSGRRREFIDCYDQLLEGCSDYENESLFDEIVHTVSDFMELNNEMMMAVRQSPWWHKYVKVSVVVVISYLLQRHFSTKQSVQTK